MLFPLSVDPAAYRKIPRITDVVGRYEKRTKRQETIQHLSGYGIVVDADRDQWGFVVNAGVGAPRRRLRSSDYKVIGYA